LELFHSHFYIFPRNKANQIERKGMRDELVKYEICFFDVKGGVIEEFSGILKIQPNYSSYRRININLIYYLPHRIKNP